MGCSASPQSVLSRLPAAACFHNLLRFLSSAFLWVSNVEKVIVGSLPFESEGLVPNFGFFWPRRSRRRRRRRRRGRRESEKLKPSLEFCGGVYCRLFFLPRLFFCRIGSLSAFLFFSFFAIFLFNGQETLVSLFCEEFFHVVVIAFGGWWYCLSLVFVYAVEKKSGSNFFAGLGLSSIETGRRLLRKIFSIDRRRVTSRERETETERWCFHGRC